MVAAKISKCRSASADAANAEVPDFLFRCSYCIKLIAQDSAVYMREDHSYCSLTCRDRGLSGLYAQLKETQLQEASKRDGSAGSIDQVHSDSSITSKIAHCPSTDACGEGAVQAGLLVRLGQAVIGVMLQRVASKAWGAEALRTYCSDMPWGREFMKNSFPPEVDRCSSDVKLSAYPSCCYLSCDNLESLAAVESY